VKSGLVLLVLLTPLLVVPAWAQFSGPAILSRGEAPAAMAAPQVDFRPFIELGGVYDTGLAGVAVNAQGQPLNDSSEGASVIWGISGSHSWHHTTVGLDYRGSLTRYNLKEYDYIDQSLLLGLTHQITRNIKVKLRQSAGIVNHDFGPLGLRQSVPFDPSTADVPITDYFDNRTLYLTSQADLQYQRTARLSFDFGGDGYVIRRSSTALYGTTGISARGDAQYRLTRKSTIGAQYNFEHFFYPGLIGSADAQGVSGTYAIRFSRWAEFSAYAGFLQVNSTFERSVPVDPVIAALLGISSAPEIVHNIYYTPNMAGRLSRTFHNGVSYVSGGRSLSPGNGLFLTSTITTFMAGYTYTGLRRWSMGVQGGYDTARAIGTVTGNYNDNFENATLSREISHAVHFVMSYASRQYRSPQYQNYNRMINEARISIGYSPGDIPLRVW
jgi:hypothetical protein